MPQSLAHALLWLAAVHLILGACFAAAVWAGGFARIDRAASRATRGARLLWTPGVILLWPVLVGRWRRGSGVRPVESTAHRRAEKHP